MTRSILAFLCASAFVLCGTAQSMEFNSYFGFDGKIIKSNARTNGLQYKNNKYGVRPYFGFKVTDELALELAHEWTASGFFRQTKEGVNISASATSALLAVSFEKNLSDFSPTKYFISGGLAHTKIRTCESGPHQQIRGYGKATRLVPTAVVGLKHNLGGGLSARVFIDWKGTNNMRVRQVREPGRCHTFKHTFGAGVGVAQEF
jgi:hypothetical protein